MPAAGLNCIQGIKMMDLIRPFLIYCPLIFLAGLVDSIGGGGGLISLPACLLAGLPIHQAIGTNKISSTFGNILTAFRFYKQKLVDLKMSIPTIIFAAIGSSIGASVSIKVDEAVLQKVLLPVLVVVALIVFNKRLFYDNEEGMKFSVEICIKASIIALVVGFYDGFYGPGGGTFLIIGLTMFARLSMRQAAGQAKMINMATCLASVSVFILHGEAYWLLGIAGAFFNMAGAYIGSGLAIKNGEKIIKPIIFVVIILLFIKVITGK